MKELFLYLSHLTFRRAINLLLCGVGFFLTKLIRNPLVLGKPYSISVEPTNRCNLSCTECPTGTGQLGRIGGDMPLSQFVKIVEEVSPTAIVVLLHFQGEPLLNPQISEMVGYATSKGLITEMATNATLIDEKIAKRLIESGLKKIVVTLDSPDEEEFGFYRKGGELGRIIRGIKCIQEAKWRVGTNYPLVILELLALKNNISQINDFIALGKNLNAHKLRVKTAHLLNLDNAEEKTPLGTKYSRYIKTKEGTLILKGKENAPCSAPWTRFSVTQDGWIVPCCFDKSAFHKMGSIDQSSVKSIWKSEQYNIFRKKLINTRTSLPVCCSCPHGRTPLDFNI